MLFHLQTLHPHLISVGCGCAGEDIIVASGSNQSPLYIVGGMGKDFPLTMLVCRGWEWSEVFDWRSIYLYLDVDSSSFSDWTHTAWFARLLFFSQTDLYSPAPSSTDNQSRSYSCSASNSSILMMQIKRENLPQFSGTKPDPFSMLL